MLVALALVAVPFAVSGTGTDSAKFSPRLHAALASAQGGAQLGILVETVGPAAPFAAAARALGVDVVWSYSLIEAFAGRATPSELRALAAQPWVEHVWLDRPVGALMDNSASDIDAPIAWNAGFNGAGVTVAVLDTGIEPLDPAFAGAVVSCVSTIGGLTSPECTDSDGHGTHVSGSIASRDTTYRGIAWGANLAVVRVLHAAGAGLSSDIIAGMDWVATNKDTVNPPIRVASMSIGFLDPGCGDGNDPEAQAADALVAAGVSFAIAAGNSGHNSCTVDGASAAFDVVTVGAVDDKNTPSPGDDTLADFSSGGPTKDGRLKPEVSAPGVGIWSIFLGPTIAELDGTSMATPHVSGAIAVLLQKEPGLSPAQVKSRIASSAFVPEAAGSVPNNDWGHGIANVCSLLGLTGCAQGAEPVVVHVGSIDMSFAHGAGKKGNTKHTVSTTVLVLDAGGAAVAGVGVGVTTTSPEGNTYTLTGTTGSNGRATVSVTQRGGGHGAWGSCVTNLTGNYDAASNVETCDTLTVT